MAFHYTGTQLAPRPSWQHPNRQVTYDRSGSEVQHYAYSGTPGYLSPTSGYLPEATGVAVAYVRNPDEFPLNRYVTYTDSPAPTGLYTVLDPDQPARVQSKGAFRWAPGSICPSPEGLGNTGNFLHQEFRCERFAYPWTTDLSSLDNSKGGVKFKEFFNSTILQQCMTDRTDDLMVLLENTANWGSNTATANTLNGGRGPWSTASNDQSSAAYLAIKRTILAVLNLINLATNAVVRPRDLRAVLAPETAMAMSETSEVHDYLSRNEQSFNVLTGEKPSVNAQWGIPDSMYGVEMVVEDTAIVREPQNIAGTLATANRMRVKNPNSVVFCSRKNGLDSKFGEKSYSTVTMMYFKRLLAVQNDTVPWDEIVRSRVVDYRAMVLTAPAAGYLVQNVL